MKQKLNTIDIYYVIMLSLVEVLRNNKKKKKTNFTKAIFLKA